MKKIIFIQFFISFIFCQSNISKAEFFLSDLKHLNELDEEISERIKKELNALEVNFKKELDLKHYNLKITPAVTERFIKSSYMSDRNKDLLFQATLKNPNMTQYEYNYLKQELSEITYETREVSPRKEEKKNKVIDINEIVYQSKPEWSDVVDSYGGYAQLAKQNINKNDWENGKFDIAATLKGIELISQTECLAIVNITGDLKSNKIPKSNYKYKGSYGFDDFNIYDIYNNKIPNVIFSFTNKKYMGSFNKFEKPITSFINSSKYEYTETKKIIDLMFDDLVSTEFFYNNAKVQELLIKNLKVYKKGKKKKGKKTGNWIYENEYSELTLVNYYNDKISNIYKYEYYENGQVKEEPSYKDGKMHGDWVRYFPNGDIRGIRVFREGLREGLWVEYHRNPPGERDDILAWKGKYVEDKKEGRWEWYWLNTNLQRAEVYKNDQILSRDCYERDGSGRKRKCM